MKTQVFKTSVVVMEHVALYFEKQLLNIFNYFIKCLGYMQHSMIESRIRMDFYSI